MTSLGGTVVRVGPAKRQLAAHHHQSVYSAIKIVGWALAHHLASVLDIFEQE